MHRRSLILRRFGALTFGLGYFEGGEWVDHTALPDRGRDLPIAGADSAADRSTVHALLSCCQPEADRAAGLGAPVPIRAAAASAVSAIPHTGSDVDAVARRSSAL